MSTSKRLNHEHHGQRFAVYLLVLPGIIFVLINALFLTCSRSASWLVWAVIGLFFCVALAIAGRGASLHPISTFALGLWCLLTVICAATLGLYLDSGYLRHYHELTEGSVRVEADPLSEGLATGSAAVFKFLNDTFVDDRRTIGYIAQGHIYCVAPVARRGHPDSEVVFWAAGIDCCEKRSNFDCGTSRTVGGLTAISYHTRAENYFRDAVGIAASVYNLTTPEQARLVGFVSDHEQIRDRIWGRALMLMMMACAVHFVFSFIVALVSRSAYRKEDTAPPTKDEAVTRWVEAGCQDLQLHASALEWESAFGCLGPRWRFFSASVRTELRDIEAWERRHRLGRDDVKFFGSVFIAEDGGLRHEVKDFVHDFTLANVFFGLVTPACIIYNTIYILQTDLSYIKSTQATVDWCIIGVTVDRLAEGFMHLMGSEEASVHVPAKIVVAVFELFFLGTKYLWLVYLTVEAIATSEVRRRWANTAKIFWGVMPSLSTFSAMQLLSYVVPSIMRLEMIPKIQTLLQASEDSRLKALLDLVLFLSSRLFFAVGGLDAFLVKFRFAIAYVEADHMSIQNILGALGFVLQLVGVVDLAFWNRQRVSDFVFGKADGKLSERERADKHVYNWMLTERIWRYSNGSIWIFSINMLKFSDVDFQRLVLNERSKEAEGSEAEADAEAMQQNG